MKRIVISVLAVALLVGGFFFSPGEPFVSVASEKIFEVAGFPVTNSMLTAWVVMLVLIVVSFIGTRNMKEVPTGLQNILEMAVGFVADMVTGVAGRNRFKAFVPLCGTILLFVLFSNWLGLLPFVGTLGVMEEVHGHEELIPLFRSPSTDLNFTVGLALVVVVIVQATAIKSLGLGAYLGKFFNVHGPINAFVGFLELVGEISKIISLSFRLFGNVFAGEILLVIIAFLVPWLAALPFMALEMFIGAIQAYIFAFLAIIFAVVGSASHDSSHH